METCPGRQFEAKYQKAFFKEIAVYINIDLILSDFSHSALIKTKVSTEIF